MEFASLPLGGELTVIGVLLFLVVGAVIMVLRGMLIPRNQVADLFETVKLYREQLAQEREDRARLTGLLDKMTETHETFERLLDALPRPNNTTPTTPTNPGGAQ